MGSQTAEVTLIVNHHEGLHARPAAMFVKKACCFDSQIIVSRDDKQADAKSILGILSLAVNQGMRVNVWASGPDAVEAVQALEQIVNNNFEPSSTLERD